MGAEHPSDAVLILALDGELATGEERELRRHVRDCPACAARQLEFARLSERLAAYHRTPASRWHWAAAGAFATAAAALALMMVQPEWTVAPAPVARIVEPAPAPKAAEPPVRRKALESYTSFVSLPFSNDTLPLENAPIVRVELPVESLRLAAIKVEENLAGRKVTADLLLGMDGLPRAIRFVR